MDEQAPIVMNTNKNSLKLNLLFVISLVVLTVLSLFFGYLISDRGFFKKSFFDSEGATVKAKIISIDTNLKALTVQNSSNITKTYPISDKFNIIYLKQGQNNFSLSTNLDDLKKDTEVNVLLRKVDGIYKITSVNQI